MSSAPATVAPPRRAPDLRRLLRRHGWTIGVYLLLFALILYWRSQTTLPWGPFDVQSLAIDALPLAFAACGQAIVVISGGIDLSIGSMMSLVNVVSARLMVDAGFEHALLISVLLVLAAALIGALTGLTIVVTKVADIIVTLAMLFVLGGCRAGGADDSRGRCADALCEPDHRRHRRDEVAPRGRRRPPRRRRSVLGDGPAARGPGSRCTRSARTAAPRTSPA